MSLFCPKQVKFVVISILLQNLAVTVQSCEISGT